MATTGNNIVTEQGVNTSPPVTFTSTDTTTPKLLFTAGANGGPLRAIIATSNDSAAIDVKLYKHVGGVNYLFATVRVATLSGTNGAAASVNLLDNTAIPGLQLDANGNRVLPLPAGAEIYAGCLVTMTTGTLTLTTIAGDL
jgi:hypothetical protein